MCRIEKEDHYWKIDLGNTHSSARREKVRRLLVEEDEIERRKAEKKEANREEKENLSIFSPQECSLMLFRKVLNLLLVRK